jgi:hypothetical protein
MMPLIRMRNRHLGRPAVILGGGPSLPSDLARVPENAVWIGINHHVLELPRLPEYLVFQDDPNQHPHLRAAFDACCKTSIVVSRQMLWTQVDVRGEPWWDSGFSSSLATWLGCFMGCDPVLLAGMDLYQGPVKYFHSYDQNSNSLAFRNTLEQQLEIWRGARKHCPNWKRIRAMSGPLVELFGAWQPDPNADLCIA